MYNLIQDLVGGVSAASNLYNPLDEDYRARKQAEEGAQATINAANSAMMATPQAQAQPIPGMVPTGQETPLSAEEAKAVHEHQARQLLQSQAKSGGDQFAAYHLAGSSPTGMYSDRWGKTYTEGELKTLPSHMVGQLSAEKAMGLTMTERERADRYNMKPDDDLSTDDGKVGALKKILFSMGTAAIIGATGGIAIPALLAAGLDTSKGIRDKYDRWNMIPNLEREGYSHAGIMDFYQTGNRESLVKDGIQQIKDGNFTRTVTNRGIQLGQPVANEVQLVDKRDPTKTYIQRGDALLDAKTMQPVVDVDVTQLTSPEGQKSAYEMMDKDRKYALDAAGRYDLVNLGGFAGKINDRTGQVEYVMTNGQKVPYGPGFGDSNNNVGAKDIKGSDGSIIGSVNPRTNILTDYSNGTSYNFNTRTVTGFDGQSRPMTQDDLDYANRKFYAVGIDARSASQAAMADQTDARVVGTTMSNLDDLYNLDDSTLNAITSVAADTSRKGAESDNVFAKGAAGVYQSQTMTPEQVSASSLISQADGEILNIGTMMARNAGRTGQNTMAEIKAAAKTAPPLVTNQGADKFRQSVIKRKEWIEKTYKPSVIDIINKGKDSPQGQGNPTRQSGNTPPQKFWGQNGVNLGNGQRADIDSSGNVLRVY